MTRRRAARTMLVLILLCLLWTGLSARANAAYHILVVNSRQQGVPWTYRMMTGLISTLVAMREDVELEVDFMHTARFTPGASYFTKRAEVYSYEFRHFRFDVVVSVGEDAFRYVMYYRDSFFHGTPIIFCGISMSTAAEAAHYDSCSVISSDWNLRREVDLIKRLLPRVRRIFFVYDQTSEGRAMAKDALMIERDYPYIRFAFLTKLRMDDLLRRIKRLPADAVLVPLPFTIDGAGKYYPADRAIRMMAAASPAPVFGLWSFELQDGVTGGLVMDEDAYGEHVAQTALRVAKGADVRTAVVRKEGLAYYDFDYERLRRAGGRLSNLPPGTALSHKPAGFYRVHRGFIVGAGVVLLILLGIIAALASISARRKSAAEERLRHAQEVNEQKRHFLRETILSVTDGKLQICDHESLRPYIDNAQVEAPLREAADVPSARAVIRAYCESKGITGDRLDCFTIAVGEAIANAIKHAPTGYVYAGTEEGQVWVTVCDQGQGIDSLILPRVALQRGFSTKVSLGMGYTIMLDIADRVLLATGDQGTTVVLFIYIQEPVEEPSLEEVEELT